MFWIAVRDWDSLSLERGFSFFFGGEGGEFLSFGVCSGASSFDSTSSSASSSRSSESSD